MHDLSTRQELHLLADLVADIHLCAPDIGLMLVGAAARDLLMTQLHGIEQQRRTNDWDFAFATQHWSAFQDLKDCLAASRSYTVDSSTPHRLISPIGAPVDFIPFGTIEQQDGAIGWPPDGSEVMSVLGYYEAAVCGLHVLLPKGQSLKTPTLPMQALLKLYAWDDRHHRSPRKDAQDLNLMLQHGLDVIGYDRLLEAAPDICDDPDFDHEQAAAWLSGYELRCCLDAVSDRIRLVLGRADSILAAQTDTEGSLALIGDSGSSHPEASRRRLIAFHRGLHKLADAPFALQSPTTRR